MGEVTAGAGGGGKAGWADSGRGRGATAAAGGPRAAYLAVAVSGACLFVPTAPALLPTVHGGGPQATALAVGVMEGCYFAGEVAGPLLPGAPRVLFLI